MIQKQRELYEAPTTQLINLRIESGILTGSNLGAPGAAGLGFGSGDNINDYTDFDF